MTLEETITPKLLSNLDKLILSVKAKTASSVMGKRKSRQRGSSLDFSDYRAYSQGDDIRKIDWNGYARSGKTNIRLYDEEKQADINIIIDSSKSMDYGEAGENKFLYARLLAASLCYVHIKNGDSVNIFAMNDEGENLKPVSLGVCSQVLFNSVVKELDKLSLSDGAADEMQYKLSTLKNGAVSFVVSDFYTQNGYADIINKLTAINQSVFLIHILSQPEAEPDISGGFTLTDSEDNSQRSLFIDSDIISEYKTLLNIHKNEIKNYSLKRNVAYFDFLTDINILDSVFEIFNWE